MKIEEIRYLTYLVPLEDFKPSSCNEEEDIVEVYDIQLTLIGIGSKKPLRGSNEDYIGEKLKRSLETQSSLGIPQKLPSPTQGPDDIETLSWEAFKGKQK
jgi:hypothetical protein